MIERKKICSCSTCPSLDIPLPLDDFHRSRRAADGRQAYCKFCNTWQAQVAQWKKQEINITQRGYMRLLKHQRGGCRICGRVPTPGEHRLSVDHNHRSGLVRGLICTGCNSGLGMFGDDANRLRAAADYLEKDPTD